MDEAIIELVDLTKSYGAHTVVDHLNLSIFKSEIFGLLGPNGAGKSTTILMMLGLTEPTSGLVRVCGRNSTKEPIEVKRKVGYLPEDVGFYDDRSGHENLVYTAQLNGISNRQAGERAERLLTRVGLSDAAHKKVGKYSRGMRQRLGLADVLIKNPEVIILDEPTLGIDPKGVHEFLSLITQLSKEEGLTVLLSSHHLHQIQEICDRVGLFVGGKLLAEGNVQSLAQALFSSEPWMIETRVAFPVSDMKAPLLKQLQGIDGVVSVDVKPGGFDIACSRNAAPDIARIVVESGAALQHLCKKEYGLDDIYNHYFKGTESHE